MAKGVLLEVTAKHLILPAKLWTVSFCVP